MKWTFNINQESKIVMDVNLTAGAMKLQGGRILQ
jgi:hypothetical protein